MSRSTSKARVRPSVGHAAATPSLMRLLSWVAKPASPTKVGCGRFLKVTPPVTGPNSRHDAGVEVELRVRRVPQAQTLVQGVIGRARPVVGPVAACPRRYLTVPPNRQPLKSGLDDGAPQVMDHRGTRQPALPSSRMATTWASSYSRRRPPWGSRRQPSGRSARWPRRRTGGGLGSPNCKSSHPTVIANRRRPA